MKVVYEADPKDYPVFHVQMLNDEGEWVFVMGTTDDGPPTPRSWRFSDGQEYAERFADSAAAAGRRARVVRRTPDEPLDSAIEIEVEHE